MPLINTMLNIIYQQWKNYLHASIPQEIREKVGITENLIRISIGIESEKDIIDDLENALLFSRED